MAIRFSRFALSFWIVSECSKPATTTRLYLCSSSKTRGAVRIGDYKYRFIDQPTGWIGSKSHADMPYLTNLRLDPFERTGWPENGTRNGAQNFFTWYQYEFWRYVFVQEEVKKLAMTAVEFPPMQGGASFNLDAVKAQIEAARKAAGSN